MAEVIIPEGYGMATMRWALTGKTAPISVTCGFKKELGDVTPQEVADDWFEAWALNSDSPAAAAHMRNTWTFIGVDIFYQSPDGPQGASSVHAPVVGTSAVGNNLKINTTMLVQKRTAFVGREQRGRMYVPATLLSDTTVTATGTINSDAVAEIQGYYTALFDDLADGASPMYLLHSKAENTPDLVTSLVLRGQAATQRRRFNA